MKTFKKFSMLLAGILLLATTVTSCEWDSSPEPEHPLYVTYTITASSLEFSGPEQLLIDIQNWIKDNQIVYDQPAKYTTGEASEFAKTDAEAVKRFETFVPKFKAYLDEVNNKLASGAYPDVVLPVRGTFAVYAARTQGQDGTLKYDQIEFVYPKD